MTTTNDTDNVYSNGDRPSAYYADFGVVTEVEGDEVIVALEDD